MPETKPCIRGANGYFPTLFRKKSGTPETQIFMQEHTLSVTIREGKGRGNSRRLRAQGIIPAVIYGQSGSQSLAVSESDFQVLMREIGGSAAIVTLENDKGGKTASLIQSTQRNPRNDRFEHIDFLELTAGHEITAHIPVHTHGTPVGVKTGGGTLEVALHEVEIKCLPKDLPEQIDLDVSKLEIGDMIHMSALPALEGVSYEGDPDTVVVMCSAPNVTDESPEEETEEAEEAEEPETKTEE